MNTQKQDKQYASTVALVIGALFVLIASVIAFTVPTDRTSAAGNGSGTSTFAKLFSPDLAPDTTQVADTATSTQTANSEEDTEGSTRNDQTDRQVTEAEGSNPDTEPEESADSSGSSLREYAELKEDAEESMLAMYIENRDRLFGGEAVLSDFDLSGWGRLREGETDDVADIEFDVENSDVLVGRADISFVHTGDEGDDKPWEVFESVSLYDGQDRLARILADSEDGWTDDGSDYDGSLEGDEKFTIRIDGFAHIIERADQADLSVRITAQDSVDDAGSTRWGLFVGDTGVRVVDAEGVQKRIGGKDKTREFDIDEKRDINEDPDLEVDRSYENPDSSVIPVENELTSSFQVFAFDLEIDDRPTIVEQITTRFDIKGSGPRVGYEDMIKQAALVIDNAVYPVDRVNLSQTTDSRRSYNLVFSTNRLELDRYDNQTVRLVVRFKDSAGSAALRGSVLAGGVQALDGTENPAGTPGSWHILKP
jgi:hypothetical protein